MTEIAWCMRAPLSLTQRVQIPLPGHLLSRVEEQVARLPCNRGQGNLRLTPEGGRQWFCARIKLKSEIPAYGICRRPKRQARASMGMLPVGR